MSTILPLKGKKNKQGVYRGEDCLKTFCERLKNAHGEQLILKRTQMKLLTNE